MKSEIQTIVQERRRRLELIRLLKTEKQIDCLNPAAFLVWLDYVSS